MDAAVSRPQGGVRRGCPGLFADVSFAPLQFTKQRRCLLEYMPSRMGHSSSVTTLRRCAACTWKFSGMQNVAVSAHTT